MSAPAVSAPTSCWPAVPNHARPSAPSAASPLSGSVTGVVAINPAAGSMRPMALSPGRAIETHAPPSAPTTSEEIASPTGTRATSAARAGAAAISTRDHRGG